MLVFRSKTKVIEKKTISSSYTSHGVRNLRVVDISAVPLPLAAHTNAPAIVVGEKASDIIKDEWLQFSHE